MHVTPSNINTFNKYFQEAPQKRNTDRSNDLSSSLTELELQRETIDFSIQDGQDNIQGHFEKLEVNAQFKFDDQLVNIHIEVEKQVIQFGRQTEPNIKDTDSLLDALPAEAREKIEKYLNTDGFPSELSPENVSDNIFNFALSFYNTFLDNQPDDKNIRQKFLDQILPAVEQGFDEAVETLDAFLSDDTRDLITETKNLTQEKFDTFLNFDITA